MIKSLVSVQLSSANEVNSINLDFSYPFDSAVLQSPAFHQKYKHLPRISKGGKIPSTNMSRRINSPYRTSQTSLYLAQKPPTRIDCQFNSRKEPFYLTSLTRVHQSERPSIRSNNCSSSMSSIRDRGNSSLSRHTAGPYISTQKSMVEMTEKLSLQDKFNEESAYDNGSSKYRSPSCSATDSRCAKVNARNMHTDILRTDDYLSRVGPFNVNNASTVFYEHNNSVLTSRTFVNSQSGLVGLANLGNTCFMNSVIQCLSNTEPLLTSCLDNVYESDLNKNSSMHGCLFTAYAELMRQMWDPSSTRGSSVSPVRFKSQIQKFAPRFMGYSQQDSQEFLRYLLQGLHEDVNRVRTRPTSKVPDYDKEDKLPDTDKAVLYWKRYKAIDNSIISDLFMGQLMSTLQCTSCGFKSTTFDPFWDLSLPISKIGSVTIKDCFDLFTKEEVLDGAEQPMCSGCKSRQRCHKSFSIQRFPPILVIHFKRFSGERSRSKLTTFIEYPTNTLNLVDYASHCSPKVPARYTLYAVSNHSGSVNGGHYTATCRHPFLENWYEYNDSRVSQVNENEVVSSEAYVLFYQMQTSRT